MDLSLPVLWNYGVQSRDYYFAIQDKLIDTKVLVTDNGLSCWLLKYSRNLKALTPKVLQYFHLSNTDNAESFQNFI